MTKKPKRPKGSGSTAVLTRPVHIKFSQDRYDAYKDAADKDGRPLVQWIRRMLDKAVEGNKG